MNIAGMLGMPRRVAIYLPEFPEHWHIISLSGFVLRISTFIAAMRMIIQPA